MQAGPDEPVHGRRRGAGRFRFPPRAPPPQAAFQPGSTRPDRSGRSYLCFNALGTLTLRREPGGGAGVIETSFHDTARHRRRVPLITDHLGFSLGHLGTQVRRALRLQERCSSRDLPLAGARKEYQDLIHA